MIQIHKLSLHFGSQTVFNEINATINANDRVGLVGRNGTGKSTLLQIIAKKQDIDGGTVSVQKNTTIAYMPQNVILKSTKNVYQEALSTFTRLYALAEEQQTILQEIETGVATEDATNRYAEIESILQEHDWNRTRAEVQEMIEGLGFTKEKQEQSVDQLSVGWKMRLLLAKLLLQKADFYLFDEPTNHLDLTTKQWFLDFLKRSVFGFLIVCHDRYFLDQLCTSILEISRSKVTKYIGNYTKHLATKAEQAEQIEAAYKKQQQEIKVKTDWINRNKAKATKAKQAQSMLKQIERMEKIEIEGDIATVAVKLPSIEKSSRNVLSIKNVSQEFDRPIFKNVSFDIERGEKIAIIAPNGTGKTTLFNLIAKKLPLQNGSIEIGGSVSTALFDQDQSKVLNPNKTIFEEVSGNCNAPDQDVRNMLGAFLFSNDAMYKKTGVLSGGERNRVAMVKVLLQKANFIMLDEPTNHLDIETKEIILKALQQYQGTIIFVSHDQEFVNQLATRIIELSPTGVISYLGNYDDYLLQKQPERKPATKTESSKKTPKNNDNKELRKQCRNLEVKIDKTQKKIDDALAKICNYEYGSNEYLDLTKKHESLKNELETLVEEWEKCFEELNN